jgi:DnaK suppressor protein
MATTKAKTKKTAPKKKANLKTKVSAKTKKAKKTAAKPKVKAVSKSKTRGTVKGTVKSSKPVSFTKGSSKSKMSISMNGTGERKLGRTYLSDKELKFFTELIVEQKNEILENARRLRESLIDENTGDYVGDNSTFSVHMAEQGTDEMEREKLYMFIQRDEKHLFYLENALERIAKKTYGLCISCGKHISRARLEAVPITSHCINCKQSLSH